MKNTKPILIDALKISAKMKPEVGFFLYNMMPTSNIVIATVTNNENNRWAMLV
jgi:hypothetical protein